MLTPSSTRRTSRSTVRSHRSKAAIALAAAVATASIFKGTATGATVTFGPATNITGDADVFNVGALNYADNANANVTVNGVSFALSAANLSSSQGMNSYGGYNTGSGNYTSLSTNYQNLLTGAFFIDNPAGGNLTLFAGGLTTNHVYAVQIWAQDPRNLSRSEAVSSSGGNSVTLSYDTTNNTGGLGQYTIGGFTADSTSQAILFTSSNVQLNAIQMRDVTGVWSGAASGNWDSASNNFTGGKSFSAVSPLVTAIYFADTDGFKNNVTNRNVTVQASGVSTGTVVFQNNSSNYTFNDASGATGIMGATAVVKTGNGTVTFAGGNTYSGGTTISTGTLQAGIGSTTTGGGASIAITSGPIGTSLLTLNGGTLDLGNFSVAVGGLSGSSGTIASSSTSTASNLTIVTGVASQTYSSTIANTTGSGNKTVSVTIAGNGTQIFSGPNTYTGITTVSSGTLSIAADSALGNNPSSFTATQLTLNGGTLGVTGSFTTSGNRGVTIGSSGGTFALGAVGFNISSNALAGTGLMTVNAGSGAMTVSGNNSSFSGKILVNSGFFGVDGDAALGATPGSVVADAITLNGGTLMNMTQAVSATSYNAGSDVTISANRGITLGANGGTIRDGYGRLVTINSVISGTGALSIANDGGTVALAGNNTFNGNTTNLGTGTQLLLTNSLALQNSTLTSGGTNFAFASSVGSHAFTFGGISGSTNLALQDNASNAVALTVGNNNGNTTYSGNLTGNGSLTKLGSGQLTLSGTNTLTTLAVTGGTLSSSGNIVTTAGASIGSTSLSASGTLAMTSGNLTASGQEVDVGNFGNGTVNLSGGTLTAGTFGLVQNGLGGSGPANTTAIVNVSGTGSINAGTLYVEGNSVTSTLGDFLNQSGGNVATSSDFRIGRSGNANTFGQYNLSGGTLSINGGGLNISTNGGSTGSMNISGGNLTLTGTNSITFAFNAPSNTTIAYLNQTGGNVSLASTSSNGVFFQGTTGSTLIYSLAGGTLTTPKIASQNAGNGTFNFNGGTLVAQTGAASNFMSGLGSSTIYSGNATINTNGQNITIAQPLLAPTGNGTTSIPVATTGTGYYGAPYVSITGGGGTGATAVASIDTNGNVTGVTITSFGSGYTSAPTASLIGNLAPGGTAATLGTVVAAANSTAGGLIKTGTGTLTLTASNTYAGGTTISGGTLRANNSTGSATGTGSVTAVATASGNYTGGMLGGSGNISGTVTLNGSTTAKLGGIITAGADSSTIGKLTTGNETWNGGAAYQWKINAAGTGTTLGNRTNIAGTAGTSYDTLQIGSAISGSLLNVTQTGGLAAFTIEPLGTLTGLTSGTTYNWVIGQVGSLTGTQITLNGTPTNPSSSSALSSSIFALDTSGLSINGNNQFSSASNFSLYFETISGSNDLVLSYNAAPEPGTALLVLSGAIPMLTGRRRRKAAPKDSK